MDSRCRTHSTNTTKRYHSIIYTASYFCPEHHHGKLISISRSNPRAFVSIPRLMPFVPSKRLLDWWKKSSQIQDEYRSKFADELAANNDKISRWLTQSHRHDITLLCWEKPGNFCHRQIVGELIRSRLPDYWGGDNIPPTKIEKLTASCQVGGLEVCCDRLIFDSGFSLYEITVQGKSAGIWTEMGAENILGQLVNPTNPISWFRDIGINPQVLNYQREKSTTKIN